MQKVERKERRGRKHTRLLWLLGAALLLAASVLLFLLLQKGGEEEAADASPTPVVLPPDPVDPGGSLVTGGELRSVTVTQRGESPWTISWEADGARLNGAEWIADSRITDRIREAMEDLVYADELSDAPYDPAEYGLADPLLTAEALYTNGETVTIRLGDKMPLEEGWYYMSMDGDPRLFAVSPALTEDLDIDTDMLHPVSQPEIYSALIDRITVSSPSGTKEWRLRGRITDQDAKLNWEVSEPFTYPADWEFIQNLRTTAGNLRMGIYLAEADPESLEKYRLAEPEYTLEIHMAAGTTGATSDLGVVDPVDREEHTEVFHISRSDNELLDYVRYGDQIFSVNHDISLSAFLDTEPLGTAARYVAAVPLSSLESLRISRGEETRLYTISREGETETCTLDGEEYPYEAFEAAYERLLTVTVSGALPKDASWEEAYAEYVFTTVSGGTHILLLSPWDAAHDAVTLDGGTLFYMPRDTISFP